MENAAISRVSAVLGVLVWAGLRAVTESRILQFAALVGVGVVIPTLLNEW